MNTRLSRPLACISAACLLLGTALPAWAACGSLSFGALTNLPTDGGSVFQVNGLNAAGQLTGFFYIPGVQDAHAFLYSNGALTDLGTLGGSISEGICINASGAVAGDSYVTNFQFDAFLAQSNALVDLGTLGGSYSSPYAINDAGQVAGVSYIAGDTAPVAFVYSDHLMTALGTLGGSYSLAFAINSSGSAAGESSLANGDIHGFIYTAGSIVDLGTLGGNYSSAAALNDSGVVVGQSTLTNGQMHGFIYSSNVMTDIGTLGGTSSSAFTVNRNGQVIGTSTLPGDVQTHGFVYLNGTLTDLGTLGGDSSFVMANNSLGQVVGYSTLSNGTSHAFLWQNGNMVDLNTLLPPGSGWELNVAQFINDAGRVVGTGTSNGVSQPFILDVTPANLSPIAVAGPDQVVECPAQVTLDASGSSDPDGDPITFQWSVAGTILGTNVTLAVSLPLGTNVVTLTVTDPCGASAQTNLTVIVQDTTPPTGSCPGPISASADANCQAAIPNVLSQVVASDNCTDAGSLALTQNPVVGTLVGLGAHPITVTVTDASGNSSTCSVLFTVADTTPPVILSVPGPTTVSADANCQGAVPNVLPGVVATDNCSSQLTLTQNPAAGTVVGSGQYTITVKAADAAGNASTASVPLKVVDTTAPTIVSTPAPLTVSADAKCQGTVPNVLSSVVATDNCTPANQLVMVQDPPAGTIVGTGQYTIAVKVTDAAGNSSTASVPFVVADTTAPTIVSAPAPITVSADAKCQGTVPNVLPSVVATDNCTPANQLVMVQNPPAGTSVGTGQYTIAVKVTDAAGNSSTASIPFVVADTTAPTIVSVPAPITVSADANCQAAVPNVLPSVVATDNCTPANQFGMVQNPPAGTVVGSGQYTITVKVADAAGNSSTATVPFQVVDTTAPTIVSVPAPITVSADANCQASVPNVLANVVATDNCTPADQLVMVQNPPAGTIVGSGQYSITVKVTDAAGNSSTAMVPFQVVATPPVIQSVTATPSTLNPPNGKLVPVTVSVEASDNCDPEPVSKIISITSNYATAPGNRQITGPLTAQLAASKGPSGNALVYTLTVQCTDASGNSSTATVNVTVPHSNDANNGTSPNSKKKN
ncbi:MAG TPA: PKD domain-containing protein [Candidatus Acidoferrum sp.]|jgi:probable HAF family extracellular repeat protein|nr:PKD domain-containing protein [Candidatus Acidoferrum sp.]